jgi:hypothetical protein
LALTLQRKLELAGDLAKVQPLLQRLLLMEKPKKRFGGRVVLVTSVVGAVTVALAAVAVLRRRGRLAGELVGDGDDPQADSVYGDALPTNGLSSAPF